MTATDPIHMSPHAIAPAAAAMTDPALWERIRLAPLPASKAQHDFARTLAYATDLPVFEAREIEAEYRRFLYLAAIGANPPVAPEPIRHAWKLHAHSERYDAFCRDVLGKPLPYGDNTRKLISNTAYLRIFAAYLQEFGKSPPATIWPERIGPRLPRWLSAHAAVLGFTGVFAWQSGEALVFATGAGVSLALYGLELYDAHLSRGCKSFSARLSKDLEFFLGGTGER